MANIGKLMRQAAQAQEKIQQIQADLATRTVEGSSGGGAVKVVAKCEGILASIKIDPNAINPADPQLLEDLVLSAVNQALEQAHNVSRTEMAKATQGLNLPGLM
jgi:DNA-binding YbaB/EbfC family protein